MRALQKRLGRRADTRVIGIFLVVFVILQIVYPSTASSIHLVPQRVVVLGIVALGLTGVLIQGNIDLSVGSTLALSAVVTVKLGSHGLAVSLIAAILVGVAVGLANTLLVQGLKIHSFIATLGTMIVVRGIALLITKSAPVTGGSLDLSLTFARSLFWFVTPPVLIACGVLVAIYLFLSSSTSGRKFYAVGGNVDAARASGTSVGWSVTQGFVICSALAGLAGWVAATELSSANPSMDTDLPLLAITAVVLGGTHLTGGRGTALGTAVGAFLVAMISTTLEVNNISAGYQSIVTGAILLVVVAADQLPVERLSLSARLFVRRVRHASG